MVNVGKTGPLLFAGILTVLLTMHGVKGYKTLQEKAVAQEGVTEAVQRWKQSYMALSGSVTQWETNYRREDSVQDLISLFALIGLNNYGLRADADNLVLTKVEPVAHNGTPLGLTKICLASGAGDGASLAVQAADYQTLFSGIDKLAKRPDIYIGNISVQGDKPVPMARLGEFCVMLRKK